MFPTLIDFGTHDLPLLGETHLFLPTYGLLFASGTVLAWWWFTVRARGLDVLWLMLNRAGRNTPLPSRISHIESHLTLPPALPR